MSIILPGNPQVPIVGEPKRYVITPVLKWSADGRLLQMFANPQTGEQVWQPVPMEPPKNLETEAKP